MRVFRIDPPLEHVDFLVDAHSSGSSLVHRAPGKGRELFQMSRVTFHDPSGGRCQIARKLPWSRTELPPATGARVQSNLPCSIPQSPVTVTWRSETLTALVLAWLNAPWHQLRIPSLPTAFGALGGTNTASSATTRSRPVQSLARMATM